MFYINFPCFDYYWVRVLYYRTAPYAKPRKRAVRLEFGQFKRGSQARSMAVAGAVLVLSNKLPFGFFLCSPWTYPMFCGFHWGFIVKLPHISRGFGYFICVRWFAEWFSILIWDSVYDTSDAVLHSSSGSHVVGWLGSLFLESLTKV